MKGKRGLSQVVTTIMLVLLGVVAVSILAGILIPYVRNSLSEDCFKLIGEAEIDKGAYACYYPVYDDPEDLENRVIEGHQVLISIKIKETDINGFIININAEGKSERFRADEDGHENIEILDGNWEIVNRGLERTYNITTEFVKSPGEATLNIISEKNHVCEMDSAELYLC